MGYIGEERTERDDKVGANLFEQLGVGCGEAAPPERRFGADEDDDIVRSGRVAGVEEVVGGSVHFAVAAGGDTDGRALFFEVVERFRIDGRELAGAEAADDEAGSVGGC